MRVSITLLSIVCLVASHLSIDHCTSSSRVESSRVESVWWSIRRFGDSATSILPLATAETVMVVRLAGGDSHVELQLQLQWVESLRSDMRDRNEVTHSTIGISLVSDRILPSTYILSFTILTRSFLRLTIQVDRSVRRLMEYNYTGQQGPKTIVTNSSVALPIETFIRTYSTPKRTASQRAKEARQLQQQQPDTEESKSIDTNAPTLPDEPSDHMSAPVRSSPRRATSAAHAVVTPASPSGSASPKSVKSPAKGKRKNATENDEKNSTAAAATDVSMEEATSVDGPSSASPAAIADESSPPKKKARRAPSASAKKKTNKKNDDEDVDEDDEDEDTPPVTKKGRAKSTGAASKKKVSTAVADASASQPEATGSQEGGSQDAGDSSSSTAAGRNSVAAAVALIESAKRAARPAGSKTIMCWNVNGLRAALRNGAGDYFDQVDADIIALCEVKADEETVKREFERLGEPQGDKKGIGTIAAAFAGKSANNISSSSVPKYHKYFNCCTTQKGYSGVGLLSKVKPLQVTNGMGLKKHDGEGRTITAEYEDYYLVCTYVPNSGQKLDRLDYRTKEWDMDLLNYLKQLESKKPVIWTGDLNVAHHDFDIHSPKTNQRSAGFTPAERKNFTTLVEEHGFVDVFHRLYPSPTPPGHRYTFFGHKFNARGQNKGWRLDYWLVTPSLMESHVIDTWIGSELANVDHGTRRSDHLPIFINIK